MESCWWGPDLDHQDGRAPPALPWGPCSTSPLSCLAPTPMGQPAPLAPGLAPAPTGQPAPSSPHSTSPMTSSPFTERRWYPSQTSSPPTSSRLSKSPEPAGVRCGQLPVQMSFLNVLQELGALLSPVGRGPDGWGFVRTLLLFYVLMLWLQGMWYLSLPTRDGTHNPCTGRKALTTRLP